MVMVAGGGGGCAADVKWWCGLPEVGDVVMVAAVGGEGADTQC